MVLKFVLAPDSYKDSASAKEICEAMEKGIRRVFSKSPVVHAPMADGGEGSMEPWLMRLVENILKKLSTAR